MNKELRLSSYQESWVTEFDTIKNFLDNILLNLHEDIIHIGSTSIPSLKAKPIIDIDIVFTDNLDKIIKVLENNNYEYEGTKGLKDRHAFKYKLNNLYEHHLYAVLKGSHQYHNHLDVKRNLLNSSKNRTKYSTLKEKLIKDNKKDRALYTNNKTELISQILMEERTMKTIT